LPSGEKGRILGGGVGGNTPTPYPPPPFIMGFLEGGKGEGRDSNYWRRDSNYYSFPFTKNPSPLPRIRRQLGGF